MKLNSKLIVVFLLLLGLLVSETLQAMSKMKSKSKLKMKSRSKKFKMMTESSMLADLWKAPGSPKTSEGDHKYLQYQINPKFNQDYSKVIADDWLSVSSPDFKNEVKFPVFYYPNHGIGEALTSQGDYTRINEKFKERPPYLNSEEEFKVDPDAPKQRDHFWFRLSDKYFYFSEDKKCINILNTFNYIDDCQSATKVDDLCFELQSKEGTTYKYCATKTEIMKKFLCKIQERLRIDQDAICKGNRPENAPKVTKPGKIREKIITQPYILIPMARGECNEDWNYRNNGKDWECLCKEG